MIEETYAEQSGGHEAVKITDELISEFISKKRGRVRPANRPWNTEANRDAIVHFAEGLGDMNPLWTDPEYAAKSRYGEIIASPTFVYSAGQIFGGGLPGVHALFGGSHFKFHSPIRVGSTMRATIENLDLIPVKGRFADMYKQVEQMEYITGDGTVATTAQHWAMRMERDAGRKRREAGVGRYAGTARAGLQHYTPDGIRGIDAEYGAERRRGDRPRYWEETEVGDLIDPIVKGPLRVTDIIAALIGTGHSPYIRGHAVSYEFRKEHPRAYEPNHLGIPDVPERVHWEGDHAEDVGLPGAYDYGFERPSWVAEMLCNWAGDDAWLSELSVELRGINIVGDVTRVHGRVVSKDDAVDQEGRSSIRCDVRVQNQLGEMTAKGFAVVDLLRRASAG